MAVLDLDTLKTTLRIDREITADDETLFQMLEDATALVEAYVGVPIESRAVTHVLEAVPSVDPTTYVITDRAALRFPAAPVIAETVVVIGPDGATVDPSGYTVTARNGAILASGDPFAAGPHVVTAEAGLSLGEDYERRDLPVMRAAVKDYVAWYFEQRNPAAEYEAAGGGVATTFNKSADAGLPARIRTALDHWRAARAVALRRRPIPSRV